MDQWIERARGAVRATLSQEERLGFDVEFYPEQSLKERRGGSSNVLVVAPHGFPGDDDHTDYLAFFLGKELDANYLINNKAFHKPGKDHPVGTAANLNRPWSSNLHTRRFMDLLLLRARETGLRSGRPPLVIAIHGMSDVNSRRYAAGDFCVGAGYTAAERAAAFGPEGSATASREVVDGLIQGLHELGFRVTDGVPQYCAKTAIPAFLKGRQEETGPLHALQIEVRYSGLRDPGSLVRTAKKLAAAIRGLKEFHRDGDSEG
jgi:hypothetical protein